jgi:hypothetical protein
MTRNIANKVDYEILDVLNKRANMANTKAGVPARIENHWDLYCWAVKQKLQNGDYLRKPDDLQAQLYDTFWVDCKAHEKSLEDAEWEYDEVDVKEKGIDAGDDGFEEQELFGSRKDASNFCGESYVKL